MKLIIGDKVVWENPDSIGFVGIKARKQSHEQRIVDRIMKAAKKRMKNAKKTSEHKGHADNASNV